MDVIVQILRELAASLRGLLMATARLGITRLMVFGKRRFLTYGKGLLVGPGTILWAPERLAIGDCVYIGKQVDIECNCEIGDYVMIGNRAAFVGRHDHDIRAVGFPIRFSPWVGSKRFHSQWAHEKVVVESDVWIGYGAIILSGTRIGRGAIVGAGAVVTRDVESYTIVTGCPAQPAGKRFTEEQIAAHERAIRDGRFEVSLRGENIFDTCVIEPGPVDDKSAQ